ncbi:MAG: peroxiredoxin [Candidatus Babeliales bacterium]
MTPLKIVAFLLIGISSLIIGAVMLAKPLAVGSQAPDFKLQDDHGNWRTLSEFNGKKVVVYFYPKDDTPGCTKEACSLRDSAQEYSKHGIVVIGISYDSVESHKEFKATYHLPFILLSDPTRKVTKKYHAASVLFGYFFPKRITYLIENGKICYVFKKIDVSTHGDDILKAFNIKT